MLNVAATAGKKSQGGQGMSIISFIKEAGEHLFKHPSMPPTATASRPAAPAKAPAPAKNPAPDLAALNRTAADSIKRYVASKGLPTDTLTMKFDGATSTVTIEGAVADQATREKIVVCCGNIASVQRVDDRMTVLQRGDESVYYTVKKGDTLSKIAEQYYGSANRYSAIFEANKPMLSDPDKIYPGQTLRIPRLS
jgi:nucleoid-associated protein YgaU